MPKLAGARDKSVSEYQENYQPWPALSVRTRRPPDSLRLKGRLDLVTDYADVYRGVRGELAKAVRPLDTVGADPLPFKPFSEYQETYKAWSVVPVHARKPADYRAPGGLDFLTSYAREYKQWRIQRTLPIIHLEQTAMPVGPFQSVTSYRCEYPPGSAKRPVPGSDGPIGGEVRPLSEERQRLPGSASTEEAGGTAPRRTQPVAVATQPVAVATQRRGAKPAEGRLS